MVSAAGIASLVIVLASADPDVLADRPYEVSFPVAEARFVRVLIHESSGGQPCIDELEIYGPGRGRNLALASAGAKAHASSVLPGFAIHQISHSTTAFTATTTVGLPLSSASNGPRSSCPRR